MLTVSESYVVMQGHSLFYYQLGSGYWYHYVLTDQLDPASELTHFRTYDMTFLRDRRNLLFNMNLVLRRAVGWNKPHLGNLVIAPVVPLSIGPSLSMTEDELSIDDIINLYEADIFEVVQQEYCNNCLTPCDENSISTTVLDENYDWIDVTLCEDCSDNNIGTCDGCSSTILVGGTCAGINSSHVTISDETYCGSCQTEFIVWCASCACAIHNEAAQWDDSSEDYYCDLCYADLDYSSGRIHYYSYTPVMKFNTADPKRLLHIGLELELSFSERANLNGLLDDLEMDDLDWFFYAKEDSTIDHGFELVTHPFQLAWMRKERLLDVIENIEDSIDKHSDSCGTHIHMSKKAFTPAHLWKFLRLHRDQATFLGQIGGRGHEADYGSFSMLSALRKPQMLKQTAQTKNWSEYISRMTAINLLPEDTMELRYPDGIKSAADAWACAEMAEAFYDFTNEVKVEDVRAGALADTGYLVSWIEDHTDEFPHLVTRVQKLIPARKTLPSKEKN
jgi:hypothetical protein